MALRITGSVIGEPITSSSSSATGMWLSQEVAALQQDGIWQIAPGFTLTSSAATVNEGASITITLTTTGILNGTAIPYVISGANIFANDSANGVITGNFVIQNNSNTISFAANADLLTEGSEAFTITAGGASTSVTINDTSLTPEPSDAQFPYTTLALHGNGTNNSQNNTFLDSSTNNFSITRNGNSTQGTFSPYGGNWSTFIGYGAYGYQSLPAKTVYDITGADFTIEFWANFSTWNTMSSSGMVVLGNFISTNGWYLSWNGGVGGNLSFSTYNSNAGVATIVSSGITAGTNFQLGTWNHFTVMQKTGIIYFYLNGVMTYSTTAPAAVGAGQTMYVGVYAQNFTYAGNPYFYYSNLRIIKGTGLYSTTGFTPSTTPLTAVANTTLLIGQSNTLVDNSPINATITNTVSGTAPSVQRFSPFSPVITTPTTYSAYFDGTGDYISVPSNAAFGFGTGDFTLEAWVNVSSISGYTTILTNRTIDTDNTPERFTLGIRSGVPEMYRGGTGILITSNFTLLVNTWYHIAVTRASNTVRIFINGISYNGTTSYSASMPDNGIKVGGNGTNEYITGYISNARIVKGTALYTGDFTPSTTPLTAVSGTSLLTCQSPTFIDNSTNAFAITAFGNSQPTQQNPFGFTSTSSEYSTTTFGGSGYLDGTGDYLTTASISSFGTGSFTVEVWVYVTAVPTGGYDVFTTADGTFPAGLMRVFINNSLQPEYFDGTNVATSSVSISLNTWNHIAITRTSGTARVYVNGIQTASVASSNNQTGTTGYIGKTWNNYYYFGYISNLRIVNGTALYTSNFAPPIAPVTAVANTSLLCNFTNAGIIDNAMMNNLETVADAKISTVQSKYGGSSMSFDGTGDYLSTYNPSYSLSVGSGDFTYECWLYVNALPGLVTSVYHLKNDTGLATTVFVLELTTNGAISLSTGTAIIAYGTAGKITTGSWIHFAFVRTSGVFKTFFNGIQDISVANTTAYNGTYLFIGAWRYSSYDNSLNGYLDDIRITKGYARYTSNFTPPTEFANK